MIFINQTKLRELCRNGYTFGKGMFTLFSFQFKYFVVKAGMNNSGFFPFRAGQ